MLQEEIKASLDENGNFHSWESSSTMVGPGDSTLGLAMRRKQTAISFDRIPGEPTDTGVRPLPRLDPFAFGRKGRRQNRVQGSISGTQGSTDFGILGEANLVLVESSVEKSGSSILSPLEEPKVSIQISDNKRGSIGKSANSLGAFSLVGARPAPVTAPVDEKTLLLRQKLAQLLTIFRVSSNVAPLFNTLIDTELPDTSFTGPLKGEARAIALREAFLKMLGILSTLRIFILHLDDIQWMDQSSWELAYAVTRRCPRVFMVLLSRPASEYVKGSSAAQLYAKFRDVPKAVNIDLEGLSFDMTKEMILSAFPKEGPFAITEVDRRIVDAVQVRGNGNAFVTKVIVVSIAGAVISGVATAAIENGELVPRGTSLDFDKWIPSGAQG
jgi:hypothetical protein